MSMFPPDRAVSVLEQDLFIIPDFSYNPMDVLRKKLKQRTYENEGVANEYPY